VVARWLLLTECFEGRHPRRAQRRKHREGRGRSGPFVCVDSRCSASVPMFSTHLGGASSDDLPPQVQRVVDFLTSQGPVHVLMEI